MDAEIKLRVATEDKARFERAAANDGRKLSDWVRRACFEKLDEIVPLSSDDQRALLEAAKQKTNYFQDAKKACAELQPELDKRDALLKGDQWTPEEQAKKVDHQPVNRILTREEREAKIDAFQRKMAKGKK